MKMIKKLMVMCAVLFTAFCVQAATRYTETVNGITWTYTVSNGKASVGGGSSSYPAVPESTSGAITIPSTLDGYPVTSIGNYAFRSCRSLTSVTIPDSVTSIGDAAFSSCRSLQNIIVDNDNNNYRSIEGLLVSKDGKVFIACPGAKVSVTIPDSVTSIGDDAFAGCESLTSVTVPDSVISIGDNAFSGCGSLTSVTLSKNLARLGDCVFAECYSIEM